MKKLLVVAAVAVLSGCATSHTYDPPKEYAIESSRTINEPFDIVWKRLVKNLSQDFFVINNIEKASHIINVSFSSDNGPDYVDCGTNTAETNGFEPVAYKVASPKTYYKQARQYDIGVINVERIAKLNGRVNIYVAPEKNKTDVTVNVKYVIPVELKGTFGNQTFYDNKTYGFSTKQKYSDSEGTICYSKGVIERDILDMAEK